MYSASLTFPASYSLTGGNHQALLIDIRRRQRHAAGRDAANILDVAVALDPGDDPVFPEHRHVHADIGQVGDPAVRAIDVVVEHDVALTNAVGAEDLVDRIDRRGERDAADGIALGVVDGNPEIVLFPHHRRHRRALDSRLDLCDRRLDAAFDDFQRNGVDHERWSFRDAAPNSAAPSLIPDYLIVARLIVMLPRVSIRACCSG